MPTKSVEVFCKDEADDSVAPLEGIGLSRYFRAGGRRTVPGFKADIAVQANK